LYRKFAIYDADTFDVLRLRFNHLNINGFHEIVVAVKINTGRKPRNLGAVGACEIKDEIERAVVHRRIILGEVIRILGADKFLVCLYLFVNHNVMPSI
jgi:hypothetical protein